MAKNDDQAEYLCTLQLPFGASLATDLQCRRARAFDALGVDDTGLYPPHVSVTGFFTATAEQAGAVLALIKLLFRRTNVHYGADQATPGSEVAFDVELRQLVATDGGHVLVDVHAPCIASLAVSLATEAKSFGVNIRPKAVRHLSLASGRDAEEQQRLKRFYSGLPVGRHDFDLVVARLLCRSDLEKLRNSREQHSFCEVLRIPLTSTASVSNTPLVMTIGHVITPMRVKRKALDIATNASNLGKFSKDSKDEVETRLDEQSDTAFKNTPPKVARADDGNAIRGA